jgi:type I restriction enzyme M protein
LSEKKTDFKDLSNAIFEAARVLRKSLNASENYKLVLALLFIKRLNDTFDENVKKCMDSGMSEKEAKHSRRDFYIPPEATWKVENSENEIIGGLMSKSKNVGSALIEVCKAIEGSKEILDDTMNYKEFNNKKKYPDNALREVIGNFDNIELGNDSLENPDVLGDAYEYLLETFADETKKKGGQFYTPREVVQLLVELMEPQSDYRICDPTCGSGGMLIHSRIFAKKKLKEQKLLDEEIEKKLRSMTLHGQESNPDTVSMCKMNMVLHEIPDARIEDGDTLEKPKLFDGSELIKYDRVLANFPFSEDWKPSGKDKDPFQRFRYGVPPGDKKADFAFIQHMLASLKKTGKAAIIGSQGVLFRAGKEENIRKRMILGDDGENLQGDIIEGIIALPPSLFYGTGIPGCIFILNKNKLQERKNKIVFINAAREGHFADLPARNRLREKDINEIVSAFKDNEEVDGFVHTAELGEIMENGFNLNVARYIDVSKPEKPISTSDMIKKINEMNIDVESFKEIVNKDLTGLGMDEIS